MDTIPQSVLDLIKTRQFAPPEAQQLQVFDRIFALEDGKGASNPACCHFFQGGLATGAPTGSSRPAEYLAASPPPAHWPKCTLAFQRGTRWARKKSARDATGIRQIG